jgi:hypothetical protein
MSIDREAVAALAQKRDPAGVVSIYVDADPVEAASMSPRWAEDVHVGLDHLECTERLHELRHRIGDAIDPTRHGRGRALFFGVTPGSWVTSFSVQMPLETSVTVSERPRLQPLLRALEAGHAAGIVVVSMAELRAVELALGEATDVLRIDTAPPPAEWSELKEPNRLREEDHLHVVREAAPRVEELARRRGWDRIVIAGNSRLVRPLVAKIAHSVDATVIEAKRQVPPEDRAPQIAARLCSHLTDASVKRSADLIERAHDAALAGGEGAVGVDDVLAAVTEGQARWVAVDADSPLHASGVRDPVGGVRLLDRIDAAAIIVERALATRADLSVVSGSEHPHLAEAGAVALLRW